MIKRSRELWLDMSSDHENLAQPGSSVYTSSYQITTERQQLLFEYMNSVKVLVTKETLEI